MPDLPADFERRMRHLLGAEAEALFAALGRDAQAGLRVNTLKTSPAALRELLPWALEPLPWTASGFALPALAAAGKHPLHAAGLYYLQDPSAMAVAEALAPEPHARVLDLAAAPGGKSTHLASLMGDTGLLVANDVHRGRGAALLENLERWGATSALVTNASVAQLAERWGALFDRVLLDAPCSGEGMFRKSAEASAQWREAMVLECARRQDALLQEAAALVAPGGRLVYSTCTFAPEENEAVVARFLRSRPDFAPEAPALPGSSPGLPGFGLKPEHLARFWPQRAPGEGHALARLRRDAGAAPEPWPSARVNAAPAAARQLWEAFAAATLGHDPAAGRKLAVFGEGLYALPEGLPELAGVGARRAGLWLGTLKKGRLEPAHALALALSPPAVAAGAHLTLALGDERLAAYLRGGQLEASGPDGWLVVSAAGFGLGWAKRSQGVLSNHYPRGLRARA